MRILALETSGFAGEVALLEDERVVVEQRLPPKDRTARSLAPGIAAALASAGWQPRDIELIAVTQGPGSFTGLRVGVTTAKTWAYATGCAVAGVDTLACLAAQADASGTRNVWGVLDAQRGELYAARFGPNPVAAHITTLPALLARLTAGEILVGSGLPNPSLPLPDGVFVADPSLGTPRAETVGRLALKKHRAGERGDFWTLIPRYFRPSAAEEKATTDSKKPERGPSGP